MKEYTVVIAGIDHTMMLDEETAKRYDAKPVSTKQAETPKNKARGAENKSKG